jgi:pimeloyl-ACP methyl ester carboxylesterase
VPVAASRGALPLLALAVISAVLAGCTVGPSDRPPVAVRDAASAPQHRPAPPQPSPPAPPPSAGTYDPASLPWRDCTADIAPLLAGAAPSRVDCTEISVAGDMALPGLGSSLLLDVTRAGSGPAPLVVLGEAGGEPGTLRAARLAARAPPELLDSYTLIGLARRGTGRSDPVDCISERAREEIIGTDPALRDDRQLRELLDTTRDAIQTCVQELGTLLGSISSPATADDLEQLRIALQAPVLNLLALGEASRATLDYLDRFPGGVGRVVLDGAAGPGRDDVAASEALAAAAEQGFDAFAADCVDRGCPLAPDPRRALAELAAQLRVTPLEEPQVRVTAGVAVQAVLETLGSPERWDELAAALHAARNGDGGAVSQLVEPLVTGRGPLPARFDPGLATRCNDTPTRVSPLRVRQLVTEWRERYPLFGTMFAQRLLLCSAWPVPAEPPAGDGADQAPPLLVIATEGDPRTPVAGTRRTASQLPSAVLVNWQGRAHGAEWRSSCVTDIVTTYLIDAQLPVPGTLCPP